MAKLKTDMNDLNEKLVQLKNNYAKKQLQIEEALKKSTKVDNEIDDLENWIANKEHEILEDEGVIVTEEQFDQRTIKYRQLKSELERKEPQVKRILETGNDMLKNSTGGISNVNDLAKNMININTKWSNLNKRVDVKNKLFNQLGEHINELRQLLHQENTWLEKVQQKLNSSKIGADAEELSEELDAIERFIKSHSHQSKERINELSSTLVDKNILIQLANSETKEFLFRWQLIHDDANKKLQSLDNAINDVQNWERRLLDFQDWVIYMDRYLATRIDQDIFADDIPDDFTRIQEEFVQNELILKDLEYDVEKYRLQGKHDAATRLDQQLSIMKKNWNDLNAKFRKFQKPAFFDNKLSKVKKSLEEIDQELFKIDVNSEDSDTIHLQLEHCMKFYKTLSELKSQIEFVLKQGRSIVDKKQVDNTEELTRQLDNLKLKYNELGSRVTNGKNELEKAFKLAKKFRKEYTIINDFMGKIDGELRKIEQKPLSKNYNDELEWIKNTKSEINKVENINLETMRSLRKSLEELIRAKNNLNRLPNASSKINDIEQKVSNMQRRIDDRAAFLHDQARKLEESYHNFLNRTRQTVVQIETLQHQLIDAERNTSKESFDRIEREVNNLLSDVEMIRTQGTELCTKSEQYSKVVETELRTVITNFEDLNRRLNLAQERASITPGNAGGHENVTTTVTTTATTHKSKHALESKYTRSRRDKSPSESSVDSTVDVFDSELRQKYMRAVAYLRILDEAPLFERDDEERYERNEYMERHARSDAVDIDFVIQQARQVAQSNQDINPDRARRILEKVHKLEQRWTATKSKRDSLKSSSKLYEKYKEREGNLNDQISVLEEQLLQYRLEESTEKISENECETPGRLFYGPSDFIFDSDFVHGVSTTQVCHQPCIQRTVFQQVNQSDNFDTRSVISEPPISRTVILREVPAQEPQPTFIRKYRTTKTTTTTQQGVPPPPPPPLTFDQFTAQNIQQQFNQNKQYFQQQTAQQQSVPLVKPFASCTQIPKESYLLQTINGQNGSYRQQSQQSQYKSNRSSSIPPPQRSQYLDDMFNNGTTVTTTTVNGPGSTTTRYFTSRNYTTTNADQQMQQQQQYIDAPSPAMSMRAASTPRHVVEMQKSSQQYQNSTSYAQPQQKVIQQQQQQQMQKGNRTQTTTTTSAVNNNMNTISSTNSRTLPVNYNQTHIVNGGGINSTLPGNYGTTSMATSGGGLASASSSCIDYSNTHYNTDWAMRHGIIEPTLPPSSTPTIIPIYQQQPQQFNNNAKVQIY